MIKSKEMSLILEEIYSYFDQNNNGLIERDELKDLLNVPDNYLETVELYKNLSRQEFTTIFQHYDRDGKFGSSGSLKPRDSLPLQTIVIKGIVCYC